MENPASPASSDALQSFDAEGTTMLFGVVPIVVILILAAVWFVIYSIKKKKMETELAAAMIDDSEAGKVPTSSFNTQDMQDMDPTKPSEKLANTRPKPKV